jgi:hypothetical protein
VCSNPFQIKSIQHSAFSQTNAATWFALLTRKT